MSQNLGVNALRGVAANSVLLFHLTSVWKNSSLQLPSENLLFDFFQNCWFGTDLFFCISGYIFFRYFINTNLTPVNFFLRRLLRILPLYWFFTLAIFLATIALNRRESFQHLMCSVTFSCNLDTMYPILVQGWTLQLELLFYIIFALSLFFENDSRRYFLVLSVIIFAIFIGHNFVFLEFLLGFCSKWLSDQFKTKFQKRNALFFSFLIFVFGLYLAPRIGSEFRVIIFGIPSMFLVAAVSKVDFRFSLFYVLGESSFSLYLIHFQCLSFLQMLAAYFRFTPSWFAIVIALIFINLLALLVNRFFDQPLKRILRR